MKIQTNYSQMTDEQLCTEMKHRFETFGETLGGYESGGIRITINNQELWLDIINDDGSLEFSNDFDDPGNVYLVIEPEHKIYHDVLIRLVTAKYRVYQIDEFKEEVDQQMQLCLRKCELCRINTINPISGHLDLLSDITKVFK